MFEENNTLATEEVDENVEQATEELVDGVKETTEEVATEEQPRMYTEAELEEIKTTIKLNAKKNAERKVRREYDKKYGRLENVLKAGTGVEDIEEMTDTFTDFYAKQYEKKGLKFEPNNTPVLSQKQAEYLAEREANEIIESGYDEIKDELNRLSDIGFDNMTASDKHMFSILKEEADRINNEKELKSIGVTELPADFKEFSDKLNPNLSMREKYDMYTKLNPKKKVEPMGSMKSGQVNKVKDYYSEDEISRLTSDDLDDPRVWEAVRKSMTGQV